MIDSGVDFRHPMFGGTGNGLVDTNGDGIGEPQPTPRPRVSGQPESPADNQKVIYFYAFNEPVGDPTDDFGHGTLVASCVAGYSVDGKTPRRTGFGTGRDGTGVGPTPNDVQLFGTAPQARIMAYKVCGPAPNCFGDIPLSVEDAASPFTLVSSGNGGPNAGRQAGGGRNQFIPRQPGWRSCRSELARGQQRGSRRHHRCRFCRE